MEGMYMSVKTMPVNDYVDKLLRDRDRVTSGELQIDSDLDYVMIIMLVMEYDREKSPYHLEFGEGQVEIGIYGIPNMIISRK